MDIKEVFEEFNFKGKLKEYSNNENGLINTTYVVEYNDKEKIYKYIVQRINEKVFKDVDKLMENMFYVTKYLKQQIIENDENANIETLTFIETKKGKKYYKSSNGVFRACEFISDTKTYNKVENKEIFKESGKALGKFQRLLKDLPIENLKITLPNFHNIEKRYYTEFIPARQKDEKNREQYCKKEIDFIEKRKEYFQKWSNLILNPNIPIRVTHNDPKINNIMFNSKTNKAICVIDLDTTMPGTILSDFGDAIRFGANTSIEDEKNLEKVALDLSFFRAYAEGYLGEMKEILTKEEINNLAFSAIIITFENGIRFLTDYLNGDIYYKTNYENHNFIRAKNQFKLVEDMEKKFDQMEEIIQELVNKKHKFA